MLFLGWFGAIRNQPTRGEKTLYKCWETSENCALGSSKRGRHSVTQVQPNISISQVKSICLNISKPGSTIKQPANLFHCQMNV